MKTTRCAESRGFTIVELLITVLVLSIVTVAMFRFYINQHEHYNQQTQVSDMQQSARVTMSLITQRVRQAGYNIGAYTVAGLSDLAITEGGANPDLLSVAWESAPDILTVDSFYVDTTSRALILIERKYHRPNGFIGRTEGSFAERIRDFQVAPGASPATIRLAVTFEMERPDPNYPGGERLRTLESEITRRNS